MYRRSLEMVTSDMTEENVNFLKRVYSLPLLNPAFDFGYNKYESIKGSGGLVGSVVTKAESAALVVAKPVVAQFEYPISVADRVANYGLTTLEGRAPIIKKTPEQVKAEALKLAQDAVEPYVTRYNNAKVAGMQKVHEVRDYGLEKAHLALNTTYGKLFVERCDQLITLSDQLIDTVLPPAGEGDKEPAPVKGNPVEKFTALSDKVVKRTRAQVQLKIALFRQQCDALIATIANVLTTLKNTKVDKTTAYVGEKLTEYQNKALQLWAELNKEEPDEQWDSKDLNQKLMTVCRTLVRRMKTTVDNVSNQLSTLAPVISPITKRVTDGVAALQDQINKLNISEVPASVLGALAQRANALRAQLNSLMDMVANLPIFSWMVRNSASHEHEKLEEHNKQE